jgi:hypothetical protein
MAPGATSAIHGAANPSNHMLPAMSSVPTSAKQKPTAPSPPARLAERKYTETRARTSPMNTTQYRALVTWKGACLIISIRSRLRSAVSRRARSTAAKARPATKATGPAAATSGEDIFSSWGSVVTLGWVPSGTVLSGWRFLDGSAPGFTWDAS